AKAWSRLGLLVGNGRGHEYPVTPDDRRRPGHSGDFDFPLDILLRAPLRREPGIVAQPRALRPAKLRPIPRKSQSRKKAAPDHRNPQSAHGNALPTEMRLEGGRITERGLEDYEKRRANRALKFNRRQRKKQRAWSGITNGLAVCKRLIDCPQPPAISCHTTNI